MGTIFDTQSGAPAYPSYMEDNFQLWLDGDDGSGAGSYPFNVQDMMENHFLQGSPYENAYAYDPSNDMDSIEERLDEFRDWVEAFDPKEAWGDLFDTANTKVSSIFNDSDDIDSAVTAFDTANEADYHKAMNRFAGAMYEQNAVMTSAYVIGAAIIENGRAQASDQFRAQLTLQSKQREQMGVLQATSDLSKLLLSQGDMKRQDYAASQELHRMNIIAQREYLQDELAIGVEDSTWDLELFKYGSNMLGSLTGVPQLPPRLPKGASALSGALGGMSAVAPLAAATGSVPLGIAATLFAGLLGAGSGYGQGY